MTMPAVGVEDELLARAQHGTRRGGSASRAPGAPPCRLAREERGQHPQHTPCEEGSNGMAATAHLLPSPVPAAALGEEDDATAVTVVALLTMSVELGRCFLAFVVEAKAAKPVPLSKPASVVAVVVVGAVRVVVDAAVDAPVSVSAVVVVVVVLVVVDPVVPVSAVVVLVVVVSLVLAMMVVVVVVAGASDPHAR